jgi:large subunit ribosomal protein L5e
MQAAGGDFNVEEGEGKRPVRDLLDVGLVGTTTGNRVFGALKVPFHLCFLCIFS